MSAILTETVGSTLLIVAVVLAPSALCAALLAYGSRKRDTIAEHRPEPRTVYDWEREARLSARRSEARR